jgi:hypothetical protein
MLARGIPPMIPLRIRTRESFSGLMGVRTVNS